MASAGFPYLDTCEQAVDLESWNTGLETSNGWYTATEAQTHILFRSGTHSLVKMCGVNNVRARPLSLSLGDTLGRLIDTLWRKHGAAFITHMSWPLLPESPCASETWHNVPAVMMDSVPSQVY